MRLVLLVGVVLLVFAASGGGETDNCKTLAYDQTLIFVQFFCALNMQCVR